MNLVLMLRYKGRHGVVSGGVGVLADSLYPTWGNAIFHPLWLRPKAALCGPLLAIDAVRTELENFSPFGCQTISVTHPTWLETKGLLP